MKARKGKHLSVRFRILDHAKGLPLPEIQSMGAAGLDLMAALEETGPIVLRKGARALIPTGLILELPIGTEAQIRPRSGLALKQGVTVLNSPGTIDSDYRGEVQVLLINHGEKDVTIERGDRIAQMIVARHETVRLKARHTLSRTARGSAGFGSTLLKTSSGRRGSKTREKRQ